MGPGRAPTPRNDANSPGILHRLDEDRFVRSLANALPPALEMMREIGGVEMPEFLGRLVPTKGADANTESDSESEAEPAANGMEEGADEAAA